MESDGFKLNEDTVGIKFKTFETGPLQNTDLTQYGDTFNVFFHEVGRLLKIFKINLNKNEEEYKEFSSVYKFKTSEEYFILNFQTKLCFRTFEEDLVEINEFIHYNLCGECFMYFEETEHSKENDPTKIFKQSTLYIYEENRLKKYFLFKQTFSKVDFDFLTPQKGLILCETTKSSNSYYGVRSLYLFVKDTIKSIKVPQPIHSATFLRDDAYAVTFGEQPAQCIVYQNDIKMELPGGNRNFVFFNNRQNLVINAGMNNLPGYFEVYDIQNKEVLFYTKNVGVSRVIWSPCGTHFLLAITNELKVSNGYTIYDYYGREVMNIQLEDLRSIHWLGNGEFKELVRPEKLKLKSSEIFTFDVPTEVYQKKPSTPNSVSAFKKERKSHTVKYDTKKKGPKGKNLNNEIENLMKENKSDVDEKDEIMKKLKLIKEIKVKRQDPDYDMTLEDMNLLFQEANLNDKLKNLKN